MVEQTSDNDAADFPDLYADLHNIAGMFYTSGKVKCKGITKPWTADNFTRFARIHEETAGEIVSCLEQRTDVPLVDIIFVQDTHLKTLEDMEEMAELWNHAWGVKNPSNLLSYWTITATKSGGAGILIQPRIAARIRPWRQTCWTDRRVVVQFDDWRLVNVYAPIDNIKSVNFMTIFTHGWMKTSQHY